MLLGAPVPLAAQGSSPREHPVSTHSGSGLEQRGREQLLRPVRALPLERWLFTREVRIQSGVVPDSHPVLTLITRYLDDDRALHHEARRPAAVRTHRPEHRP